MERTLVVKRLVLAVVLVAAGVFLYVYFSAFLPILLALLTAAIFEPLIRWLKKKMRVKKRVLPVTIVFTTFIAICAYSLYISFTKVAKTIYDWVLKIPEYALEIQKFINNMIERFNRFVDEIPQEDLIISEMKKQSENLTESALQITTKLVNLLGDWLQSIPNLIFVMLIYFIASFLISLDFPRIVQAFYNLFKPETADKLRHISQKMGEVFLGYWKAQFILSIGVFVITYVSLLFISPKAALVMSIIIWVVDIIPLYVGPAIVLVPWGLLAMMLGDMNKGIELIMLATVLLILRRIIEPKVLGDSIGLAALPTVLSMYFGFVFFGMTGLILGPFVYIAIRSAMEAGLFDIKFLRGDKEEPDAPETAKRPQALSGTPRGQ